MLLPANSLRGAFSPLELKQGGTCMHAHTIPSRAARRWREANSSRHVPQNPVWACSRGRDAIYLAIMSMHTAKRNTEKGKLGSLAITSAGRNSDEEGGRADGLGPKSAQ